MVTEETLFSSAEAAEAVGCTRRSIQRAAEAHQIGRTVGRFLVFSQADIDKLSEVIYRSPGNPNLGAGSNNGGGRKPKKAVKKKASNARKQ